MSQQGSHTLFTETTRHMRNLIRLGLIAYAMSDGSDERAQTQSRQSLCQSTNQSKNVYVDRVVMVICMRHLPPLLALQKV